MRKLRAEGHSIKAICELVGRGHSAVAERVAGVLHGSAVRGDSKHGLESFPQVFTDTIRRGKEMGLPFMDAWTAALDTCGDEPPPGWEGSRGRPGWQSILALTMASWQAAYEDQPPLAGEAAVVALAELAESEHSSAHVTAFVPLAGISALGPSDDPAAARKAFSQGRAR